MINILLINFLLTLYGTCILNAVAYTLAEIEEYLTLAKAAYKKTFDANNYSISSGGNSRSIGRQKMEDLLNQIKYWEGEKTKVQNGTTGIPVKFITQIDE